jgi:hypothetical protein
MELPFSRGGCQQGRNSLLYCVNVMPQKETLDKAAYTCLLVSYRRISAQFQFSLSAVTLGYLSQWCTPSPYITVYLTREKLTARGLSVIGVLPRLGWERVKCMKLWTLQYCDGRCKQRTRHPLALFGDHFLIFSLWVVQRPNAKNIYIFCLVKLSF